MSEQTWTAERITIPVGDEERKDGHLIVTRQTGTENVDAIVSGLFAIHKSVDGRFGYVVTHRPSGYGIASGIATLGKAKAFCRDVEAIESYEDWLIPQTPPYTAVPPPLPIMRALNKAWGLNTAALAASAPPPTAAAGAEDGRAELEAAP
jgi:hypothetical protein